MQKIQKIAAYLDRVWNWLVMSSANENSIALTVKGSLATGIAYIIGVTGAIHLQIPDLATNLNAFSDQVILVIQYALGIVGVISTIIGLARKIYLSFESLFLKS